MMEKIRKEETRRAIEGLRSTLVMGRANVDKIPGLVAPTTMTEMKHPTHPLNSLLLSDISMNALDTSTPISERQRFENESSPQSMNTASPLVPVSGNAHETASPLVPVSSHAHETTSTSVRLTILLDLVTSPAHTQTSRFPNTPK